MNVSKHPVRYFFDRAFPSLWSHLSTNNWPFSDDDFFPDEVSLKGVRIYEENQKLHVEVPLAGLNADEIEVNLNQGVLWIRGESKKEEEKNKKFYRSSKRQYSYSIALPTQIDEKEQPEATYADGILKVSLRLAKQSETKKISVKSGKTRKE